MRRGAVAVLTVALLVHAAAAAAAAPLSPLAFRDRYAAAVAAATHAPTAIVDERTFSGRRADGADVRISIDNAYAAYLHDPETLDAVIQTFVRVLTTTPDAAGIDQLIVIVRPKDYLARSVATGASLANFLPSRPLGGDLAEFLAVDSPDSIRNATPDDLARWKMDLAQAWVRAVAKLKTRIGPLTIGHEGQDDGASVLGAASGLAPSLLAEPELCDAAHPDGVAGQVLLIYTHDAILFGVPEDAAMMARFWRAAVAAIGAGTSLSATPLVCSKGVWRVVAVPALRGTTASPASKQPAR